MWTQIHRSALQLFLHQIYEGEQIKTGSLLGDLGIRARALNSAFKMLNEIKLSLPEASISIIGAPSQRERRTWSTLAQTWVPWMDTPVSPLYSLGPTPILIDTFFLWSVFSQVLLKPGSLSDSLKWFCTFFFWNAFS